MEQMTYIIWLQEDTGEQHWMKWDCHSRGDTLFILFIFNAKGLIIQLMISSFILCKFLNVFWYNKLQFQFQDFYHINLLTMNYSCQINGE